MRGGTVPASNERADILDPGGGPPPRHRRRGWVIVLVLLVVVAAGAVIVAGEMFPGDGSGSGSSDNGSATALARVERQTLSTQRQFTGTLGYAGSYAVSAQAHGTMTWLPEAGRVVRQGQVLYRVDEAPVVLLYGATPAYRTLSAGAYASQVTGRDVAQLNHDLVALGDVRRSDVDSAWDEFNWATRAGVQKLQHRLGVKQTGRLMRGDVVFLPTPARVTRLQASLGGPATGPVLSATSTARMVSVELDASLQSEVNGGDRVTITLPDGRTTPGRVSSMGTVATVPSDNGGAGGSGSGPTVPVTIRLTHPSAVGGLDQALVEVSITDQTVRDVFAVRVTALLALSGGGYAVEVVADDGTHHLVSVTPGLFDDATGMVQVSGSGLTAGQHVVVPGNG